MGKPAARISDTHQCPLTTPVPHVDGPITGPGAASVLIGNLPAATTGDICTCAGAIDVITSGSSGVFIEGRPAARLGDRCAHGGIITSGCASVLIGESLRGDADEIIDDHVAACENVREENNEDPDTVTVDDPCESNFHGKRDDKTQKAFCKPRPAQRIKQINQAIHDASDLLDKKLKLLEKNDRETLKQFKKWFGRKDEKARRIILTRIRKELKLMRSLNENNFTDILNDEDKDITYAMVQPDDLTHTIRLGNPFWDAEATGRDSKAGILIHEVSHFVDVGETVDHEYGDEDCLDLAMSSPDKALFNADSFERFIESDSNL